MKPSQLAELLQVTERTVYRWIQNGDLEAIKIGRGWRITKDHLEKFMQNRHSA